MRTSTRQALTQYGPMLLVLGIGLLGTWNVFQLAQAHLRAERQTLFNQEVQNATAALKERAQQCEAALREAQGFFAADPTIQLEQWRAFAAGLNLTRTCPGVAGLAFIARVPQEQSESFIATARARNPAFEVRPEGSRPEYRIIKYHEPMWRNAVAIGYDVGTIPAEREAMDRACDSDQPTLSATFTLVQDRRPPVAAAAAAAESSTPAGAGTDKPATGGSKLPQPGQQTLSAVLLLPVYADDTPHTTVAERRQALIGWVSAPLRIHRFLDPLLGESLGYVNYRVYDENDSTGIYCSTGTTHFEQNDTPVSSIAFVRFGERGWAVEAKSDRLFDAQTASSRPRWAATISFLVTLLLTGLVWSLTNTGQRARTIADQVTRTLRQSESEARKLALIARSTDNSVLLMDAAGCIEWVNDSFTRITGYTLDDVHGKRPSDLLRDGPDGSLASQSEQKMRDGESFEMDFAGRAKDGHLYWANARIQPVRDEQGHIIHYMAIGTDITHRKQTDRLETERRHVLEMIAQNQPLETTLKRLVDLLREQTGGQGIPSILMLREGQIVQIASELPATLQQAIDDHALALASGLCRLPGALDGQLAVTDVGAEPAWEPLRLQLLQEGLCCCWAMPIICGDGGTAGVVTVYVRQRREAAPGELAAIEMAARVAALAIDHRQLTDLLSYRAQMDPLTGVANRALLEDRLQQALRRAQRHDQMVGLLFIDLDRFKLINDTLGHQAGDQLLRQVCQRLQENLRRSDVLVRMGGDEFTLILQELRDREDAVRVAKKLLRALKLPFDIAGQELFICASVGIAIYPHDGQDAMTLQRNADTAMYRAKGQGGHTYVCFAPEMNVAARERLELENQLRRGIERDELLLHYQPQIDRHGQLVGFEALLRWRHPKLGLVPPAKFIPLAEENGLIVQIGSWVLRQACRQNRRWQQAGHAPLRVSVNVSAMQFAQMDFVDIVQQALKESDLEARWLELELTESLLMRNTRDAAEKLSRLRELGVGVAIDDFGTGYSSLAYLQHLPIDTVKIDRSFVLELGKGRADAPYGNDTAVIRAITSMAHSLGMDVVAEGVETEQQLGFLLEIGCNAIQGYLISQPVPVETVPRLMTEQAWVSRFFTTSPTIPAAAAAAPGGAEARAEAEAVPA